MKNFNKILSWPMLLLVLVFLVVASSCKKEEEDKPAPDLPPKSAFVMDFSEFDDASDTAKKSNSSSQYWGTAFINVTVWNTIIALSAIVPVAAYQHAITQDAEYLGDNKWEWKFNFKAGNNSHSAVLTGELSNEQVNWEMKIDGFTWYTGTSRYDRTSGSWILYKSPSNAYQLLEITWHRNSDGTSDIRYENIVPEGYPKHDENGGYIEYGIVNDTIFDAYYEIYNKGADNLTNIQWNRETRAGRISDPNTFNDSGKWHCWDSNLQDMDSCSVSK